MKKFKSILFALCLLAVGSGMLVGCNKQKATNSIEWTTISTADDLTSALATSGNILLAEDIEMTNSSAITVIDEIVLNLNGHKLSFNALGNVSKAAITVSGSEAVLTISDSVGTGEIYSNGYGLSSEYGGTIVVNGGNFVTINSCLSSNNLKGIANFTINGGTFSSLNGAACMYLPAQGQVTITGGTFNSGISVRMGQINISGGNFYSFNTSRYVELVEEGFYNNFEYDTFAQYFSASGNIWFGNALTIYVGTYTFEDETYGNSLNLNITGGTFINDNEVTSTLANNTIQIYIAGRTAQTANITISGGTFTSKNGSDISVIEATSETTNASSSQYFNDGTGATKNSINLVVADGLFTADVSDYINAE